MKNFTLLHCISYRLLVLTLIGPPSYLKRLNWWYLVKKSACFGTDNSVLFKLSVKYLRGNRVRLEQKVDTKVNL